MFTPSKTPIQEFRFWKTSVEEAGGLRQLAANTGFCKHFGPMGQSEYSEIEMWSSTITDTGISVTLNRDSAGVHVHVKPELTPVQKRKAKKTRKRAKERLRKIEKSVPYVPAIVIAGQVVPRSLLRDELEHQRELMREMD